MCPCYGQYSLLLERGKMMAWWKEYILSIIGCVFFCGIIGHLVSDLRHKKVVQLVSGTLLTITVLGPLSSVDISDYMDFEIEAFSPEQYVDMGKQAAWNAQEQCIKETCESYISSKANELGMMVSSEVHLNEMMEPAIVRIHGQSDSTGQHALEVILEEDLGITKENQVWIWNQEKDN